MRRGRTRMRGRQGLGRVLAGARLANGVWDGARAQVNLLLVVRNVSLSFVSRRRFTKMLTMVQRTS